MSKIKWSISKVNTLRRCGRQFYFGYVAAHHSFKNPFRRTAFELQKMKNLKMWKGSLVDLGIEKFVINAMNDNQPINVEQVIERTIELAKRQFEFSARKKYKIRSLSRKQVGDDYCILEVHEDGLDFDSARLEQEIFEDVRRCFNNFFTLFFDDYDLYLLDFLKSASWRRPNIRHVSFSFENFTVSPQIDLLLYRKNKPIVIDWKISQNSSSDYSKQLLICGIAVKHAHDKKIGVGGGKLLSFSDVGLYEINLLQGIIKHHVMTKGRVNEIVDYIYETGGDIELLVNGGKFNEVDIKKFGLTDNTGSCAMCNFRRLCVDTLINSRVRHENQCYQLF